MARSSSAIAPSVGSSGAQILGHATRRARKNRPPCWSSQAKTTQQDKDSQTGMYSPCREEAKKGLERTLKLISSVPLPSVFLGHYRLAAELIFDTAHVAARVLSYDQDNIESDNEFRQHIVTSLVSAAKNINDRIIDRRDGKRITNVEMLVEVLDCLYRLDPIGVHWHEMGKRLLDRVEQQLSEPKAAYSIAKSLVKHNATLKRTPLLQDKYLEQLNIGALGIMRKAAKQICTNSAPHTPTWDFDMRRLPEIVLMARTLGLEKMAQDISREARELLNQLPEDAAPSDCVGTLNMCVSSTNITL